MFRLFQFIAVHMFVSEYSTRKDEISFQIRKNIYEFTSAVYGSTIQGQNFSPRMSLQVRKSSRHSLAITFNMKSNPFQEKIIACFLSDLHTRYIFSNRLHT
jgi:hypothetical protein